MSTCPAAGWNLRDCGKASIVTPGSKNASTTNVEVGDPEVLDFSPKVLGIFFMAFGGVRGIVLVFPLSLWMLELPADLLVPTAPEVLWKIKLLENNEKSMIAQTTEAFAFLSGNIYKMPHKFGWLKVFDKDSCIPDLLQCPLYEIY